VFRTTAPVQYVRCLVYVSVPVSVSVSVSVSASASASVCVYVCFLACLYLCLFPCLQHSMSGAVNMRERVCVDHHKINMCV